MLCNVLLPICCGSLGCGTPRSLYKRHRRKTIQTRTQQANQSRGTRMRHQFVGTLLLVSFAFAALFITPTSAQSCTCACPSDSGTRNYNVAGCFSVVSSPRSCSCTTGCIWGGCPSGYLQTSYNFYLFCNVYSCKKNCAPAYACGTCYTGYYGPGWWVHAQFEVGGPKFGLTLVPSMLFFPSLSSLPNQFRIQIPAMESATVA